MKQQNDAKESGEPTTSTPRQGFGAERPSRRVLEGHTRPCEDCGAVNWDFDTSRGEITCEDCGLVVEENVPDPGAEWTNRDNGEDRSRVGRPMTYTLADKGLNTTIDVRDLNTGTASRHGMSSQARRDWRRRRVIDERSKTRKRAASRWCRAATKAMCRRQRAWRRGKRIWGWSIVHRSRQAIC